MMPTWAIVRLGASQGSAAGGSAVIAPPLQWAGGRAGPGSARKRIVESLLSASNIDFEAADPVLGATTWPASASVQRAAGRTNAPATHTPDSGE